jgi:hypothetical protein
MSGLAVAGQRGARAQGLSSSRSNPNLFERDEGDADALFQCDNAEAGEAHAVRRTSVSNVLKGVPKDVDDLVQPLGVDIDALAAAAEPVAPVKKDVALAKATPQKAPGD